MALIVLSTLINRAQEPDDHVYLLFVVIVVVYFVFCLYVSPHFDSSLVGGCRILNTWK